MTKTKQHRFVWSGSEVFVNPEFKPVLNKRVQSVDFYCGGGGFSTGAAMAGAEVVLAVDFWMPALRIHHANHPETMHLCIPLGPVCENCGVGTDGKDGPCRRQIGDEVVEFEGHSWVDRLMEPLAKLIRSLLDPDAHFHLHGSPPCQELSNASNHKSEGGMLQVNWFLDFVKYIQPDSWSMENVVGVRKYLEADNVPYVQLNSADFGVPQTRKRIFAGAGWKAMPTHEKQDWVSVIEALPHLEGELKAAESMKERWSNLGVDNQFPTITSQSPKQIRVVSRRKKAGEEPQHYPLDEPAHTVTQVQHIMEEVKLESLGANSNRKADRTLLEPSPTICGSGNQVGPRIFNHDNVHLNTAGSGESTGEAATAKDREITQPSKVIRGHSVSLRDKTDPMAPQKIRSLTIEETATLQGFPKDYKFPYKVKNDAWVVIGNAVCPQVAEAIILGIN
jgi:site-specific DNA-cytosine methylase